MGDDTASQAWRKRRRGQANRPTPTPEPQVPPACPFPLSTFHASPQIPVLKGVELWCDRMTSLSLTAAEKEKSEFLSPVTGAGVGVGGKGAGITPRGRGSWPVGGTEGLREEAGETLWDSSELSELSHCPLWIPQTLATPRCLSLRLLGGGPGVSVILNLRML